MSEDEERSLTRDEMRIRLYHSFKRKGVLDNLKTQLRNRLIVELQQDSVSRPLSDQSDSLCMLASNSLVVHHLQNSNYQYTLSVFYPECGLSKEKVLSVKDILQLLKISPQSAVYKNLVSDIQNGQNGLLVKVLLELLDHHVNSEVHDAETQTSNTLDYSQSLVRKMQMIDEEYEVLRQRGSRWASVEAKLAEYRKEMEEQAQTELKSKIQHFQEVEIARVRMEEKEKCQQEVQEIRRQLERNYEMKSEALMTREKNAIERLQKQQEIEEKEIYAQRQVLLKEIESVRNREAELSLRNESFQKSCKLHEEKIKNMEELLRKRELDIRKMEETHDQKLNNEIKKYQLELKEDYSRRSETLVQNENRNKEETMRIQQEAAIIHAKTEEHQRRVNEIKLLQEELASSRVKLGMLERQNAVLNEKLGGVSDYFTLLNEQRELQAEVVLLKKKLEESEKQKQQLHQELKTPSPELLTLQVKLERLETAWRLDQKDFHNQKQIFHTQLEQERERCAQLKLQLQECEERTKWMSAHTEEIKQQLRHTQQALENEVLRNPKPSVVDQSGFDNVVSSDIHVNDYHDEFIDPGATRGWRHTRNDGAETVTEALTRIQELEKEAEVLEEAYKSYRRKVGVSQIPIRGSSSPSSASAIYVRSNNRVTFGLAEPTVQSSVYAETALNKVPTGCVTPPTVKSPPIRRLSSTPVSALKINTTPYADQDGSAVTFSGSLRDEVSPIPAVYSAEDVKSTPPSSPELKSIVQDNHSSSQESSPQPDKICIQDLTQPQTDVQYSLDEEHEEETLTQHRLEAERKDGLDDDEEEGKGRGRRWEEERRMEEERRWEEERRMEERRRMEEERRWEEERRIEDERRMEDQRRMEEERRMKDEKKWKERMEAQEREKTDLEELHQELLQQEVLYESARVNEEDNRDERMEKKLLREKIGEEMEENSTQNDPLHKYMMMVMQKSEQHQHQNSKKEESEILESPEQIVLSDHQNDSVAALSNQEADDDFW